MKLLKNNINRITLILISLLTIICCSDRKGFSSFSSKFPSDVTRTWIGPEYWANPMQDWQLKDGRIECIVSGGDRNVVLLTREITKKDGEFILSAEFGKLNSNSIDDVRGWIGFKVGIQGEFSDYRDSAVRGEGFPVGITMDKRLFIGSVDISTKPINFSFDFGKMILKAKQVGDKVKLNLRLLDRSGKKIAEIVKQSINSDWTSGMVSVVCNSGSLLENIKEERSFDNSIWGFKPGTGRFGNVKCWFKNITLEGDIVKKDPSHSYGPILFSQYTLSNETMKLTVQLPPLGEQDNKSVFFQVKEKEKWKTISNVEMDKLARTARFKIKNWDSKKDTPYRIMYQLKVSEDELREYSKIGIIRKEPWEKEEVVVAAFTGNNDLGFPNNDIVSAIKYHNPDLLFFSGDQIYEGVGGYGTQTDDLQNITLDYLRKWYLFGWAYGDLMSNCPTVTITDDHDVYHGNIWGANGIATPKGLSGAKAQDAGGYKYYPEWVNMVQRTQTSHLPDPYDPTSIEQGIGVYYCNMNYAGISFAIIEDRKFKSAPKPLLPQANVFNGWAQNKSFNAKNSGDVKGAVLLGKRQLEFLDNWSSDWTSNIWMKVLLSQTIFADLATLPKEKSNSDSSVPYLKIFKTGEYPPNDIPVQDMDSNGWPQSPRNKALKIIRKAFAIHIAGDQHLGSTIQYGVDNWGDAGFAFCVPAISNVWPRRWFPIVEGKNREHNMPKYTGDFKDGFGNLISVHAVSNPFYSGRKPSKLYDRATGYGIVKFNRNSRDIIIESWPRWVDPSSKEAKQYPGWPIIINQRDNYGRKPVEFLPELIVQESVNPEVQIINQANNEILYTLRIIGQKFQPFVFKHGFYSVRISELGTNNEKIIKDILSSKKNSSELRIKL